MSVNLSPLGGAGAQFFTNDGVPLTGGLLYTYLAGTSTPATTYTSSSGITALANPIILDAAGRVPTGEIWLSDGISYKFVLKDSTDVLIATWDGLSGINSNFIAYTAQEETATATAGQTVFNLTLDYTAGANNLAVFVNGSNQIVDVNYTETDSNTVTFLTGLNVGDVVKFSTATPVATNATDAANVSYTPAGVGAVTTSVQTKLRETISVTDYGAVGDGVTDDTTAIQNAITEAAGSAIVYFPAGTYKVTGTLEMPLKVSGNFTIDGDIIWSFKKEILQEGQITVTGDIDFDSVWFSKINHIEAGGDVTLYSSNVNWGVFWNDFGTIRCNGTLKIDTSQLQSINQNIFTNCRCFGGLLITGTGVEAHNNLFLLIDTTGADLTASDGTTGCHVLNDSNLNQTNTVEQWYAESSGKRIIKGNWNVLGSTVDSAFGHIQIGRFNSYLNARVVSRNGSFIPQIINNLAQGGDWSQLTSSGLPLSLTAAGPQTLVTDAPDGNRLTMKSSGGATFVTITISYKLTTSSRVTATAYVYQEGTPRTEAEIYDNLGALVSGNVATYTPLDGNWYLLRVVGAGGVISSGSSDVSGQIRLYTTTASSLTSATFRQIGSYIVTTDSYCPLPSRFLGNPTVYTTAVPTTGTWAVGTIAYNTTPTSAGFIGWVCTSASDSTTGTINSASNSLAVASGTGINNGDTITVAGAGVAGANLTTTVTSGGGTATLILGTTASTSVVSAAVTTPGTWKTFGLIS